MKITESGAAEVIKALGQLGGKIERKVLRAAMRKGLKPLLAATKATAPVDEGKLRDSLVVRAAKSKKRGVIALEVRPNEKAFAGEHFYPAQVEFGTSNSEPNPFMAEAFSTAGESAKDVAIDEIAKGIDNIVKGG